MARHKARIPRRGLRRKFQDLTVEHQRLQRAFRTLEARWSEAFQEAVRLQETYEPAPGTSWGVVNAAAQAAGVTYPTLTPKARELFDMGFARPAEMAAALHEELAEWDPERTEQIPVSAVGIDLVAEDDSSGIAVIKVSEDGTAEVIKEEESGK